ncbi:hypothetical protein V8F20_007876 [Naviculisporaceae sp. PSN 640]
MAGLRTIGKQGLEVLSNPENPTVDIIAIPGLGANPDRSWLWDDKDPKSFNWLTDKKDGLPKDFSTARILLFRYSSAYHGPFKIKQHMINIARTLLERLHTDRKDASRRPIVLIGHSMGGLVAAKLLILAEQHRTSFPHVYESIVGCVTFGTPFDGAPVADIAQQWTEINLKLGKSVDSKLLDLLKPGNEALRELKNDFVRYVRKLTPNVELYCFYEQNVTRWDDVVAKLTSTDFPPESLAKLQLDEYREFVSRSSATINGFEELGLARAHRDLVRFKDMKDPDYQLVRGVLRRIVNSATRNAKSRFNCTRQSSIDRDTYKAVVDTLEGAEVEKKLRSLTQRFKLSASPDASASWITKEPQYHSWLNEEDPNKKDDFLWIHGPEGNGKTVAVTSVIREIKAKIQDDEQKHPDRPPTLLAYFFCDAQAPDFGTAEDVVKSFLRQLCQQQDVLATYAKNFVPKTDKTGTKTGNSAAGSNRTALSIENLWQCLRDMLTETSIGNIYFVVGNLHELPEPENDQSTRKLLSFLQAAIADGVAEPGCGSDDHGNLVGGGSRVRTKWLISSRDRKSIQTVLKQPPTVREIDLEDQKYENQIKRELQKHARARVETLEKQKGYNRAISWFAGSIIGSLAESTKWIDVAVVQLASLPANSNDIIVRKMLERVPQDFAALLNRAWTTVLVQAGEDLDMVKELLRALVLTYQDPTESELLVLTGLSRQRSSKDPDPDDEEDRKLLRRLIDTCKPMLVRRSLSAGGKEEISFVNPDVKKHLRDRASKFIDLPEDEIKLQHGILALRCYTHVVESVTHFLQNRPPAAPPNPAGENTETEVPKIPGTAPSVADASRPDPDDSDATNAAPGSVYAASEYFYDDDEDSYWSDDELTKLGSPEPVLQDAPAHLDSSAPPATDGPQQQEQQPLTQPKPPARVILPYAAKNWLRHASESTPDIAERLSLEEEFWARGSQIRNKWLVEYNGHTGTFHDRWPLESFMALHVAASIGFPNLVKSLMKTDHKQEVHEYDAWANTPLHLAAWVGNAEIVEVLLLSGGARIDDAGPGGNDSTPLAMAVQGGRHLRVMEKLLSWNANPDTVDSVVGPVINGAILSGNMDAVQLLIHHNARLNYDYNVSPDRFWLPPLATAAQYADLAMLDAVLVTAANRAEKLSPDEYLKALVSAAISGRVEVVERLMAEYMPTLEYLQVALQSATDESNWDVVRMFLKMRPDEGRLDCNRSFKAAATSSESFAIVKDILSEAWEHSGGAIDQHVLDECLYVCTDNEEEETVKLLLEMGASPDAEGQEYGNALAAAANDGTMGILHALLDKGATIDSPAGYPLQAACKQGHLDAVKLLLTHERSPPGLVNMVRRDLTPLQAAAQSGQAAIVKYLLQQGADPNIAGEEDDLPILLATSQGDDDVVKLLLNESPIKVNVNVISRFDGCSPLHNAVISLPAECAELLLQAGADIEMFSIPPPPSEPASPTAPSLPPPEASSHLDGETNQEQDGNSEAGSEDDEDEEEEGFTALMHAADVGDEDCVKVLLSHGADILALSKTNKLTALEIAQREDETGECAKLLMERMLVMMKLLKEAADMGDRSAGGIIARERQLRAEKVNGTSVPTASEGAGADRGVMTEPGVYGGNPASYSSGGPGPGPAGYGGQVPGAASGGYGGPAPGPTSFGGPVQRGLGGPNPAVHGFGEAPVPNSGPSQHMTSPNRGPPGYNLKTQDTWGPTGGGVQDISWIAGGLEGLHLGQGAQHPSGPPQNQYYAGAGGQQPRGPPQNQYYGGGGNMHNGQPSAPQERAYSPYRPPGPSYGQGEMSSTRGMMQRQENDESDAPWQARGARGGQAYYGGGGQSFPNSGEKNDDDDEEDQGDEERHMQPDYEGMGYDASEGQSDVGSNDGY